VSQSDVGRQPEPETDPAPDESPGGPADRVERDPGDYPLATPDQPMSAQVEEEHVPDEIEQPEELDEEEQTDSDDSTQEPAG
jgi:hypothetical protein